MSVYTFPCEVKLSVAIELWLPPWVMRKVMSTKTRNMSFNGQPNVNPITQDISHKWYLWSICVILIEWMLTMEWMSYVADNWSNHPIIIRNVYALKDDRPTVYITLTATLRFAAYLSN